MTDNNDTTTAPAVTEVPEATQAPPVTMTPFDAIQQAKVTALIKQGKSEAAKGLRETNARILRENETLRASLNLPQDTVDHLEAMNAKLLTAKQEYARYDGLNRAQQKREALNSAATAVDFFDATVGATLLAAEVTFEGDALIVIDPATGEGRLNAHGEPMSIAELAREKSSQHPYMVRSMFKGGAGSLPTTQVADQSAKLEDLFGPSSNSMLANRMAMSNPMEYRRKRALAVSAGIIRG